MSLHTILILFMQDTHIMKVEQVGCVVIVNKNDYEVRAQGCEGAMR